MQVTISLCIIAKNEADLIAQCLKSALPYVDQIVVVDTGSSDQTKKIARSLGAEVWDLPWNNDFSAARNFSLEKARGDWILFMDCDEEIAQDTGEHLLASVQNESFDAYYINIINLLAENNEVAFHSIRLFRNLPQFRFEGKIHEQISFSIFKYSGQEKIGRTNFTLLHHGYNPEKVNIQAKIARNLELLQDQQTNWDIKDGFFLYNLGIEYVRQGKFQEALENFIEALKYTKSAAGYAPSLVNKTVVCLIELKRYRDALEQLANFQKVYPDYSDLYLLEAACHLRCGRYSRAAENIEKAQLVKRNKVNYPVEGTIFGQKPEKLLATFNDLLLSKEKKFKLSVCILANDEENNITRCIKSINELADEIILVTTGANDHTLHIAYQLGAHIYRVNWDNSFAKLRNFALKQTSGDWVLILNGDEELKQANLAQLVQSLNVSSVLAYFVCLQTFYDKNNWALYAEKAVCKIIKNKHNLHYQSCLVEDIDQAVAKQHSSPDLVGHLPLIIYDYGPISKPHLKLTNFFRNITLIVKDFKALGKTSKTYTAMGNEFMKIQQYKTALVHFKQAFKLSKQKAPANLWYKIINCLVNLNNFTEALELSLQAGKYYPDYTNIIYLQGYCNLQLGYLDEAKECFEKCLKLGKAPWEKYLVQPGTGSYLAHIRLAEVCLKQKMLFKCLRTL